MPRNMRTLLMSLTARDIRSPVRWESKNDCCSPLQVPEVLVADVVLDVAADPEHEEPRAEPKQREQDRDHDQVADGAEHVRGIAFEGADDLAHLERDGLKEDRVADGEQAAEQIAPALALHVADETAEGPLRRRRHGLIVAAGRAGHRRHI